MPARNYFSKIRWRRMRYNGMHPYLDGKGPATYVRDCRNTIRVNHLPMCFSRLRIASVSPYPSSDCISAWCTSRPKNPRVPCPSRGLKSIDSILTDPSHARSPSSVFSPLREASAPPSRSGVWVRNKKTSIYERVRRQRRYGKLFRNFHVRYSDYDFSSLNYHKNTPFPMDTINTHSFAMSSGFRRQEVSAPTSEYSRIPPL